MSIHSLHLFSISFEKREYFNEVLGRQIREFTVAFLWDDGTAHFECFSTEDTREFVADKVRKIQKEIEQDIHESTPS